MRKVAPAVQAIWIVCATTFACSQSNDAGPSAGVGGGTTVSPGGSNSTGGHSSAGGASATGGNSQAPSAGGSIVNTGGANTGGISANGGVPATGGSKTVAATGGLAGTGGTKATGGVVGTGGLGPVGGSNATGGSKTGPTGGSGAVGTGGKQPTGGVQNAGGSSSATGGSSGVAGGKTSTGGTATAGGTAAFKCANLSFKSGTTGKSKPSGAAGGMKVLNWAGFSSAISYTFDDANSSQINNYTAMKNAGGHYTFYLISGKTEASNQVYKTALADGHEMGNHTSDHSNCNSASTIDAAQTFIKNTFGVTGYAFAAPNGSTACNVSSVSNKFLTNRSVAGNSSMSPGDINSFSWLPADVPPSAGTGIAPISGKWRVICLHGFQGGTDGAYQAVPLSAFTSAVQSAISGDAWVETVSNVAAYQWGQHAIGSSSTSATWTLPSVFPPNMCVRITTSGGTVTQKGQEVPWDDHGYYEISLDAGSVTIQ